MSGYDVGPHAAFMQIGSKPEPQRLDAEQIDLGAEQPAGVIFAKAGWLHQRKALVVGRIRPKVSERGGQHD